ncbi:MAG: hypothetical protein ACPGRZ_09150 [Alphaproteobacteria bacterium]
MPGAASTDPINTYIYQWVINLRAWHAVCILDGRIITDTIASIPARSVPASPSPNGLPGLEDDSVDTGQFWSTEEGPTFSEFLDIVNPLQHIPIVSSIYRAITGDEIGAGPRFIGGILFGGPIGALAAGVTSLFEEASGGSIGNHVASLVDDILGEPDDVPENSALNAPRNEKRDPAQVAELPATPAAAAALNRITLNPAAALGVAQTQAALPSSAQAGNMFGGFAAPRAGQPVAATPTPARGRPMSLPFDGPAKNDAPDTAAQNANTARMDNALARSRRQQTDLLLAQWAAQQMAAQKNAAPATAPESDPETRAGAVTHPMLPPRNASPEWYAQAMDRALSRYNRAGQTGQPTAPAGFPVRR